MARSIFPPKGAFPLLEFVLRPEAAPRTPASRAPECGVVYRMPSDAHNTPLVNGIRTSHAAPLVHIFPACGFPPQSYVPLVRPLLQKGARVVCLLPRMLWRPAPDIESLRDWRQGADDLLEGVKLHGLGPFDISVGHSFGGTATLLAAVRAPELFKRVVMMDPIFMGLHQGAPVWSWEDRMRLPMAARALKRQKIFPSVGGAVEYLERKANFSTWDKEALWEYCSAMLPRQDGTQSDDNAVDANQARELWWSPEWEAQVYAAHWFPAFTQIPEVKVPLTMIYPTGEQGEDNSVGQAATHMMSLEKGIKMVPVKGGHFFPMVVPDVVSAELLGELGPKVQKQAKL